MARLRDARPKNRSGGYDRLFGNSELGLLASKVQSTVISSGTELERMIATRAHHILISDLNVFLTWEIIPDGVHLALKPQIKQCKAFDFAGAEPDFMIFQRRHGVQMCHVVELKDGHVFDTKKASAERRNVHDFVMQNAVHVNFDFLTHFCAFNQDDKQKIVEGFKYKITEKEAMTGREFCELLEIDYDDIVKARETDCDDNLDFYLQELVSIESVSRRLRQLLCDRNRQ